VIIRIIVALLVALQDYPEVTEINFKVTLKRTLLTVYYLRIGALNNG